MNPFKKIKKFLNQPTNSYIPSTLAFVEHGLDHLSQQLKLKEKATQHGLHELPSTDSKSYDSVETEIINTLDAEKKRCHEILLNELHAYDNRINALNLKGKIFDIKHTAENARSEFETESRDAINKLEYALQNVQNITSERKKFKKENNLNRTANYPEFPLLNWGIIFILALLEVFANASYLAIGDDNGFLGGSLKAMGIGFLNITIGLFTGKVFPFITHVKIRKKILGFLGIILLTIFSVGFNLFVSHYRMALNGNNPDFAGTLAIQTFNINPFQLDNFDSWMMFFMGVLCFLFAAIDSFKMDDSYFGYGRLERKYKSILDKYANNHSGILQELRVIKDDAINLINEFKNNFSEQRVELDSILVSRQKVIKKYKKHAIYLDNSKQHLLNIYREYNMLSRKTAAPNYFNEPFTTSVDTEESFDLKLNVFKDTDLEIPSFFKSLDEISAKMHLEFITIQKRFPLLSMLCERENDE